MILKAWMQLGIIKRGDEVLVPSNTFIASVLAVVDVGLVPVLVEPNLETYTIDPNKIEEKITSKSRVLMPVHLYGRLADMESICRIAAGYDLLVLEDAAQAHGARQGDVYAGAFGDAGAFSFYPGKNLGAFGDAGAVVTNDRQVAVTVAAIGNYGSEVKYDHKYEGYNSRLDEIQAALLSEKLKKLDVDNLKRKRQARLYTQLLSDLPVVRPLEDSELFRDDEFCEHVFHLYVIRVKNRGQLIDYLNRNGIEVGIHYPKPLFKQKALANLQYKDDGIASKISEEVLSIPIGPHLMDECIDRVSSTIRKYYTK